MPRPLSGFNCYSGSFLSLLLQMLHKLLCGSLDELSLSSIFSPLASCEIRHCNLLSSMFALSSRRAILFLACAYNYITIARTRFHSPYNLRYYSPRCIATDYSIPYIYHNYIPPQIWVFGIYVA